MLFSNQILQWYFVNKRTLPWRNTKDPYRIWLSEIMLQQTKVAQGIPYYKKFVKNFPTVYFLAKSKEEKVLKLWQGLGYYSRARNLHVTAKNIVENYNGDFPDNYKELIKLKGVGDYTASAIASICFDKAVPVVDGNVYRVFARYFGIDKAINSTEGIKYFKQLAHEVMHMENPRDYNQGIMEFGALQCTPKKPKCTSCPLNTGCLALKNNEIEKLPVKLKKLKVRKRYFNYVVVVDALEKTVLRQRIGKGIWQNLYEFPLIESDKEIGIDYIRENLNLIHEIKECRDLYKYNEKAVIHKLSHQHLYTTFWVLYTDEKCKVGVKFNRLEKFPVPVLIAEFIKAFKI
ncbi:MAG: A/G-specific adenine glycosylase [Cellulophaga sp.]